MATYSIDHRLPSCAVNKDLLADIETYFLQKWSSLNEDKGACSFVFSITDSIGSEDMMSVKDYKFHLLPDDIKEATLEVKGNAYPTIRVSFRTVSVGSDVRIVVSDQNARELARGILTGILEILGPFKTRNYIFDPTNGLAIIGWLFLTMAAAWAGISLAPRLFTGANEDTRQITALFGPVVLCVCLGVIVFRLHPYTTFETRLNQKRAAIWNRLFYGVLASLVAAVIIAIVSRFWN